MSPSLSPLLRFAQCERVSAVHDAENVAVRIFEPGDFVIAGDVHVALALRLGQVIVLERDAFGLERADDVFDIVDRPGQGSGFVRASEGGPYTLILVSPLSKTMASLSSVLARLSPSVSP